jgi:hypothetical protein
VIARGITSSAHEVASNELAGSRDMSAVPRLKRCGVSRSRQRFPRCLSRKRITP